MNMAKTLLFLLLMLLSILRNIALVFHTADTAATGKTPEPFLAFFAM